MRITGGKNPLDATAVHPESYDAAKALLDKLGFDVADISAGTLSDISKQISNIKELSAELGVGEMTLEDIVKELEKPGRDPREDMPKPILKSDVLEIADLKPGMVLKGTVRNVIDFGCFVDIGVHQDGLVHISQITDRYIKHPLEAVSVGDIVDVEVLSVDEKKGRISLTMKLGQQEGKPGAGDRAGKSSDSQPGKKNGRPHNGKSSKDRPAKKNRPIATTTDSKGVTRLGNGIIIR